MRQTGMTFISMVALIYVGFCAFLYMTQRNALYYPTPEVQVTDATEVRLESDGETLKIWHLPNSNGPNAIIYFGGNAEDVSGNIPQFRNIFPGYAVFLVNYRGYGGSTGSPTEAGLYRDALTVFDEIHSRHKDVSVIGRSLGAAVATYLASVRDVQRLVLVTPFDSIENVAKGAFPIFPVSLLIKDRFDAAGHVAEIDVPVLVVIAGNDEIIPRRRSDALAEAFPESQATVEVIRGAGHNTIGMFPDYSQALSSFMGSHLGQR